MHFIYYIPSFLAIIRKRPDILKIFLFNMFLGWTIMGWILALIWSLQKADNNGDGSRSPHNP